MSEVIDVIKGHHRELMAHIIDGNESLAKGEVAQLDAFVQFLKSDLLPHAGGEESHLYPAIDVLIHDHGRATATMSVDLRPNSRINLSGVHCNPARRNGASSSGEPRRRDNPGRMTNVDH